MKKKFIGLLFICSVFISCNSSEDKNEEPEVEVIHDTVVAAGDEPDSSRTIVNKPLIWTVDAEPSGTDKLKAPANARLVTFSSAHLIKVINDNFPEVKLDLVKISHDTMYVKIPDSKVLTQEMGSTGAQNYMASATYTLTEMKGIKYVSFAMKEGDHSGPGVLSRADFSRLR